MSQNSRRDQAAAQPCRELFMPSWRDERVKEGKGLRECVLGNVEPSLTGTDPSESGRGHSTNENHMLKRGRKLMYDFLVRNEKFYFVFVSEIYFGEFSSLMWFSAKQGVNGLGEQTVQGDMQGGIP